MNKVMFSGNLGADAEVRNFENGNNVVSFSIAHTKKGFKKKDGTEIPDKTTWMRVNKFNAAGLAPYLTKGTRVEVFGELEVREYDGKTYTSIVAHEIELGGIKQSDQTPTVSTPSGDLPF
jgi:single-strand DNA-binding protein